MIYLFDNMKDVLGSKGPEGNQQFTRECASSLHTHTVSTITNVLVYMPQGPQEIVEIVRPSSSTPLTIKLDIPFLWFLYCVCFFTPVLFIRRYFANWFSRYIMLDMHGTMFLSWCVNIFDKVVRIMIDSGTSWINVSREFWFQPCLS